MPLFSDDQIARSAEQAEDIFASEYPCIIERNNLAITAGVSEYTLDSAVSTLRKVLWKGVRLYPTPHREFRTFAPNAASGRPDTYIYNDLGQQKIKFFPTPNETISDSGSGFWGTALDTRVVIEYFRTPDYSTYKIPAYLRRRLLKAYVLKMRYRAEGRGKSLKAAKYFSAKWEVLKQMYGDELNSMQLAPIRLILGGDNGPSFRDSRFPHLSYSDFGISVREGE